MANLLRVGAQWLQKQRHTHCTDQVSVGGVSLLATCPKADKEVEPGGVKLTTRTYQFILRSSDVEAFGISIVRGLTILWDGNTYEVINEGGLQRDNDPTGYDVIVNTVRL